MKILLFDPFSGAAGDMIIGSLISLGADGNKIKETLESILDISMLFEKKVKLGIESVDVKFNIPGFETARSYREIENFIKRCSLASDIENDVSSVFGILADAESKVHGKPIEELHFHEVGQTDALADIIGSCIAMNELGVREVFCLPINTGTGTVNTSHGIVPIPAPATLEILKASGLEFYGKGNTELLTPTGAALLAHFAKTTMSIPAGKVRDTGYGAGDIDTDWPNVLRTFIIETDKALTRDEVEVLETSVDDVTGEVLGNLFDRLLDNGAKDVSIIPATMKKGRPGHIIEVVTNSNHSEELARIIMEETGSLGIRTIPTKHRYIADRKMGTVELEINDTPYQIAIKIACTPDSGILHISAEYDDCKEVSKITGIAVREIIRKAQTKARDKYE
ncbi:nickel pincer cofactor biosynthesis protein LarC [Methanohalophilus sp.]